MSCRLLGSAMCLCLFSTPAFAADTEYERWKASTQKAFKQYLSEQDKAFIGFLQRPWQTLDTDQQQTPDNAPKPDDLPVAKPAPEPTPAATQPRVKVKPPATVPVAAPIAALPASDTERTSVNFFGEQLSIALPAGFQQPFNQRLNGDHIAQHWQSLAKLNWQDSQKDLRHYQRQLQLNDWAMVMLLKQLSELGTGDRNSQVLLNWFLLLENGFDARIAYNQQQAYVLIASSEAIFGETFFKLDGNKYYALNQSKPGGRLTTYGGQHAEGTRAIQFDGLNQLQLDGDIKQRQVQLSLDGKDIQLTVDYSKTHVDFLNTVPQLELTRYFDVGLPPLTQRSFVAGLRPLLTDLSEQQALNRLLHIVQSGFEYQTDGQQFGEENYLFPLETLHYPYSDCEDRAALFAHLVSSVLDLPVIITDYPGHVATAVAPSTQLAGDKVQFQGRDYLIADPTYINANLGMTMPHLAKVKPKLLQP